MARAGSRAASGSRGLTPGARRIRGAPPDRFGRRGPPPGHAFGLAVCASTRPWVDSASPFVTCIARPRTPHERISARIVDARPPARAEGERAVHIAAGMLPLRSPLPGGGGGAGGSGASRRRCRHRRVAASSPSSARAAAAPSGGAEAPGPPAGRPRPSRHRRRPAPGGHARPPPVGRRRRREAGGRLMPPPARTPLAWSPPEATYSTLTKQMA